MTAGKRRKTTAARRKSVTPGQFCFGWFSVFCLFLILKNPGAAIDYVTRGLHLCAATVIPSLFPFMVLSELIVSGGIGEFLLRKISRPFTKLFRLPAAGCCAVLLGMLCGFPVGARCAMLAMEKGELTREEAERVLTFANNPSSAFLINAVGISLWGNRRFGLVLFGTVLASALAVGFLFARFPAKARDVSPKTPVPSVPEEPKKGIVLFTGAIRSATGSMLLVCAYVLFFSAFVGTLNLVLSVFSLPEPLRAVIFCLFELSGGMSAASALSDVRLAALLCGFAAGWSGFSVHCQVLSVCDGRGLRFRRYFLAKLLQGLLCALLLGSVLALFPDVLISARAIGSVLTSVRGAFSPITAAFLFCLVCALPKL